ncbi:MAG: hypothetical protein LBL26_01635 [Peptococcaceae bacterium]|jgi:hypothetical protein|nr:hypothetical protein [Peptococcaceae bacterium]
MVDNLKSYSGSYWDYVQEIARERAGLEGLIRCDIGGSAVRAILAEAGFTGYRLRGALEWVTRTMEMIRALA